MFHGRRHAPFSVGTKKPETPQKVSGFFDGRLNFKLPVLDGQRSPLVHKLLLN